MKKRAHIIMVDSLLLSQRIENSSVIVVCRSLACSRLILLPFTGVRVALGLGMRLESKYITVFLRIDAALE